MKGLKARVISATDTTIHVEICSNMKKIVLPREDVVEIKDPTQALQARDLEVAPLSFDAASKEFIPLEVDENGNPLSLTPKHIMADENGKFFSF